uniref:Uncharacterized protein n=1 Tax=Oryza glumipatula TaxID=40148 RepID=A0A0D9ZZD3_9ORYZ
MLSTIGAFLMWAVKTIDSFLPCPHRPSAPQGSSHVSPRNLTLISRTHFPLPLHSRTTSSLSLSPHANRSAAADAAVNSDTPLSRRRRPRPAIEPPLKFLWDGATSNFMETSSIAAPWRHHSLPLDHRRPASIGGTDT